MAKREDVVSFLNTYLQVSQIPDSSLNGLQVQGRSVVKKVVFGVSACMELFKKAAAAHADMVIVHHGLLWGKEQAITGLFAQRVKFLLEHQISLLGYHLPLDKHALIGHNALLLNSLRAEQVRPFASYHGQEIGFCGQIKPTSLSAVARSLEKTCTGKALMLPFGPKKIQTVGIVSGGGWSMLPDAISLGLDLFVTGALDEPVQELCREGKINCIGLGHYNSEKIGVQALMKLVKEHFEVETQFIEIKNPI